MLIVALVLAVIGLAALVTAVVTSNELIAWVCIVASAVGVLLLIVDAVRDRTRRDRDAAGSAAAEPEADADYPEDAEPETPAVESVPAATAAEAEAAAGAESDADLPALPAGDEVPAQPVEADTEKRDATDR